jgi:hypothetical protein
MRMNKNQYQRDIGLNMKYQIDKLFSDSKLLNQLAVSSQIMLLEVIQQSLTLSN